MERVFNFSAGPSMLPLSVLESAQKDLLAYGDTGMSVMEMSHRSKMYEEIIQKAENSLRELLNIPDNYKVLFLQGGASSQFAMVPLNLMTKNGKADYVVSGQFSGKAYKEAKKRGEYYIHLDPYITYNIPAGSRREFVDPETHIPTGEVMEDSDDFTPLKVMDAGRYD